MPPRQHLIKRDHCQLVKHRNCTDRKIVLWRLLLLFLSLRFVYSVASVTLFSSSSSRAKITPTRRWLSIKWRAAVRRRNRPIFLVTFSGFQNYKDATLRLFPTTGFSLQRSQREDAPLISMLCIPACWIKCSDFKDAGWLWLGEHFRKKIPSIRAGLLPP